MCRAGSVLNDLCSAAIEAKHGATAAAIWCTGMCAFSMVMGIAACAIDASQHRRAAEAIDAAWEAASVAAAGAHDSGLGPTTAISPYTPCLATISESRLTAATAAPGDERSPLLLRRTASVTSYHTMARSIPRTDSMPAHAYMSGGGGTPHATSVMVRRSSLSVLVAMGIDPAPQLPMPITGADPSDPDWPTPSVADYVPPLAPYRTLSMTPSLANLAQVSAAAAAGGEAAASVVGFELDSGGEEEEEYDGDKDETDRVGLLSRSVPRPRPRPRFVLLTFPLSFWALAVSMVSLYVSCNTFTSISSDFMQTMYGVTSSQAGQLSSFMDIAATVVVPLSGLMFERIHYRSARIVVIANALFLSLAFWFLASGSISLPPALMVIGSAYAIGASMLWPRIPALVRDPSALSTAYGVVTCCVNGTLAAVPAGFAHLIATDPTFGTVMRVFAGIAAVGAAAAFVT
ncbi:major facilitator superfamily domain-containing protein [Blastocladiella britannica]|nr:major facilitator superfamily domain-containing protein [Blastocladiella britannica]